MNYKLLKELILGIIILLPFTLSAQHYEMVKVDGRKKILVWEFSIPLDGSRPVLMPEDYGVPFIPVDLTIWRPSMENDTAFWNNLGKQLWGRDCKIERIPYTCVADLIKNESLQQVNTKQINKSESTETVDDKTKKRSKRSSDQLSIFPNPANTYTIVEYSLPANAINASISIYNAQGVEVWLQDVKRAKDQVIIDLSNIPSGSYRVALQSGNQTLTSKSLSVSK